MDLEETTETIESRQQRLASVPRACEGCRIRKIRCDRTVPCSHCRSSGISCQNTSDKPTSRSRSDRVKQLETHVSHLQRRLRSLEDRLVRSHTTPETHRASPTIEENAVGIRAGSPATQDNQLYQGETSFTFQSLQASELTGRTIGSNAQSDLESAIRDLPPYDPCTLKFSTPKPIPSMKPLPAALVIGILRRFKTRHPIFLSSFAVNDLDLVEKLCRHVYFPVGQVTVGQVTSMHGILFFLLREYKAINDPLIREYDMDTHISQCEQNLVAGLETYDILAVPSFENILALVMGVLKAQEEGKPFLYCTLISSASTHCQTLGYHREKTYNFMKTQEAENIRRLFWTVYVFDKNVSLLLGRSSHIQDTEVDTNHLNIGTRCTNYGLYAWGDSFIQGIELAKLQGQIYTSLYSAAGMKRPPSERLTDINSLSEALEKWKLEFDKIKPFRMMHVEIFYLSRGNWDIAFYSTLTSLYRAFPDPTAPREIDSRCFKAARYSLEAHLKCLPKYQKSGLLSDNEYFNFVLLFASFTPFVVTFHHAIASNSLLDLRLLKDVTSSLENVQQASKPVQRLLELCRTCVKIAEGLVQRENPPRDIYNVENDMICWENEEGYYTWHTDILRQEAHRNCTDDTRINETCDILEGWIQGEYLPMELFERSVDIDREPTPFP